MTLKDHGMWEAYVPDPWPEWIPSGALCCRRVGDGVDWYEYIYKMENIFESDTMKFVLDVRDGRTVVRTPAVEPDRLYPAGFQVVEMMDIRRVQNEAEHIVEFANRFFDPETGELGEQWIPSLPSGATSMGAKTNELLEEILARLERLEKRSEGK